MTSTINKILFILGILLVSLSVLSFNSLFAGAAKLSTNTVTDSYNSEDLFASSTNSAITATGTVGTAYSTGIDSFFDSSNQRHNGTFDLRGAKRAVVYFTRGGTFGAANTGTTTFSVEVTPDGTNWYAFSRLVSATSSGASTVSNTQVVASAVIGATAPGNAATSTLRYALDISNETYKALRCKVVTTVDGAASCFVTADF